MRGKTINILFRCDSSSSIGLGHVMRCLVLAKRLIEQSRLINISFATQELDGNINYKILKSGFKLYTLKSNKKKELIDLVSKKEIHLLIIDSYKISSKYEKSLVDNIKYKTLVFDDTFKKHYSDMVLNHGIQAEKKEYKELVSKETKIFCGAKYTILRDEFFKKYKNEKYKNNVAIILGGSDTKNLSLKISKLLEKISSNYKITIITSRANPYVDRLKRETSIKLKIDSDNIAKTLSKQSFVICASGGTLFEVISLKKKFINIRVAKNQDGIVNFLKKRKILSSLDANEINKINLRAKIDYVMNNKIYDKLDLEFYKYNLAKDILNELK